MGIGGLPDPLAAHDAVFRHIAPLGPDVKKDWMAFMEEIGRDRRALRDIRAVLDDYSESRIDALVAVGKIGLRLYAEPVSSRCPPTGDGGPR